MKVGMLKLLLVFVVLCLTTIRCSEGGENPLSHLSETERELLAKLICIRMLQLAMGMSDMSLDHLFLLEGSTSGQPLIAQDSTPEPLSSTQYDTAKPSPGPTSERSNENIEPEKLSSNLNTDRQKDEKTDREKEEKTDREKEEKTDREKEEKTDQERERKETRQSNADIKYRGANLPLSATRSSGPKMMTLRELQSVPTQPDVASEFQRCIETLRKNIQGGHYYLYNLYRYMLKVEEKFKSVTKSHNKSGGGALKTVTSFTNLRKPAYANPPSTEQELLFLITIYIFISSYASTFIVEITQAKSLWENMLSMYFNATLKEIKLLICEHPNLKSSSVGVEILLRPQSASPSQLTHRPGVINPAWFTKANSSNKVIDLPSVDSNFIDILNSILNIIDWSHPSSMENCSDFHFEPFPPQLMNSPSGSHSKRKNSEKDEKMKQSPWPLKSTGKAKETTTDSTEPPIVIKSPKDPNVKIAGQTSDKNAPGTLGPSEGMDTERKKRKDAWLSKFSKPSKDSAHQNENSKPHSSQKSSSNDEGSVMPQSHTPSSTTPDISTTTKDNHRMVTKESSKASIPMATTERDSLPNGTEKSSTTSTTNLPVSVNTRKGEGQNIARVNGGASMDTTPQGKKARSNGSDRGRNPETDLGTSKGSEVDKHRTSRTTQSDVSAHSSGPNSTVQDPPPIQRRLSSTSLTTQRGGQSQGVRSSKLATGMVVVIIIILLMLVTTGLMTFMRNLKIGRVRTSESPLD